MENENLVEGLVRLVPATLEICDGPYRDWMQDEEVLRYLEARFSDCSRDGLRAFVEGCLAHPDQHLFAICLVEDDRHVGNIKLQVDPRHGRGDIGIVVGDAAQRGRGIGSSAIRCVTRYAFDMLDLVKVTAGCYAPNEASVKAFLRAGFSIEATRPSHYVCDGARVAGVFLALMRADA